MFFKVLLITEHFLYLIQTHAIHKCDWYAECSAVFNKSVKNFKIDFFTNLEIYFDQEDKLQLI